MDFKIINKNSFFEQYIKSNTGLEPTINIMTNQVDGDFYKTIGQYIVDKYNGSTKRNKMLDFYIGRKGVPNTENSTRAITFFSSILDEENLEKLFKTPIKHSHYGEGFHENDDEDYDGRNTRDYDAITYMFEIGEKLFHVDHDHRGTSFSVDPYITQKELNDRLKIIVDEYFKID